MRKLLGVLVATALVALGGIGVEADGFYSIDGNAMASTQDAPQFGFDVSVQTSRDQLIGVLFGPA
jgi:hypothetical protein